MYLLRSPPTTVLRVRIPDSAPCVGSVCSWLLRQPNEFKLPSRSSVQTKICTSRLSLCSRVNRFVGTELISDTTLNEGDLGLVCMCSNKRTQTRAYLSSKSFCFNSRGANCIFESNDIKGLVLPLFLDIVDYILSCNDQTFKAMESLQCI